jgi:hypothetical protein
MLDWLENHLIVLGVLAPGSGFGLGARFARATDRRPRNPYLGEQRAARPIRRASRRVFRPVARSDGIG